MFRATSIVATPLQSGQFKTCPHCSESLAQTYVRTDKHEKFGELRIYRCCKCGKEVEYLVSLPRHVV